MVGHKQVERGFVALLVALAYYVTATAGLLWSIPPGYATLVWIPAGVALGAVYALGARVLFGVVLGSWCANVWVPSAPDREAVVLAAMLPALGAGAQAYAGAWLMRRYLREGWIWDARGLARFAIVATLSCGVNGIWGPTSLAYLAHVIAPETLQAQIKTWWMGDAIGALLTTPLVAFLVEEQKEHVPR